jgi:FMN phosphatase YigB (HAD superfamily)
MKSYSKDTCINLYKDNSMSQSIVFFDFDGTLTSRDSLMPYLYQVLGFKKFIIGNNEELSSKRRLVRLFLHYMYYNCDIGQGFYFAEPMDSNDFVSFVKEKNNDQV